MRSASIVLLMVAAIAGCGGSSSGPPPATAAQRLNGEGLRLLERGEQKSAEGAFHDALREAELVDDLLGQAEAWNNLGATATARGDAREAWACHAAALRLYRARGVRDVGEVRTRTNLGGAMLAAGEHHGAKRELAEAARLGRHLGDRRSSRMAEVGVASVELTEGDAKGAGERARRVAEEARNDGDPSAEAAAIALEGAALEVAGDAPAARARFTAALEIDRKREQPLAVLGDLVALGRLAERAGDGGAASSFHARASRVARRLGQLELAERELTLAVAAAEKAGADGVEALRAELAALRAARQPTAPPGSAAGR